MFKTHIVLSLIWIWHFLDPQTVCSQPGSSIHGISQARILEWVAISFSSDLLNPGIEPPLLHYQIDFLPLSHLACSSK